MSLFEHFANRLIRISERRSPDFIIGGAADPYLRRWWLIPRNRFFNVYLHQFLHSDEDRALHDHPWINLSILLRGRYIEVTPGERLLRDAGAIILRGPRSQHRVELISDATVANISAILPGFTKECWTLFITGPRLRNWGFHCPQGFVPWQDFTARGAKGETGKGCDQ